MPDDRTDTRTQALDILLSGRVAAMAVARDWPLLREVAGLAQDGPPAELKTSDPALHGRWLSAVDSFHARGWGNMTPERVDAVAGIAPAAAMGL